MIVTRCPHCQTGFRVTPEQIKACDGRVRCGECTAVFDALENLITAQGVPVSPSADAPDDPAAHANESNAPDTRGASLPVDMAAPADPVTPAPAPVTSVNPAFAPQPAGSDLPGSDLPDSDPSGAERADPIPAFPMRDDPPAADTVRPDMVPATPGFDDHPAPSEAEPEPDSPRQPEPESTPPPAADPMPRPAGTSPSAGANGDEAPAHARAAGLSAARDTRDVPGYNKWSEGTLTSSGSVFVDAKQPPRWPYVLTALVLAGALAGQAALQFRSELAARLPASAPLLAAACEIAHCTLGLPRQAELISIESSELQSDPERGGLLVLAATLRNRAAFSQDFPALELSLTDTRDQPLVRKVLQPADYLPAGKASAAGIGAGAEQAVRLWIDGKSVGAAGYRLYVFYP